MLYLIVFVSLYFLAVYRLDKFYMGKYFWDQNCEKERFFTCLLQPFMELFGNSMTAHFWHFKNIYLSQEQKQVIYNFELPVNSSCKPFRVFNRGKPIAIITSACVDVNPMQECVIIQPKIHTGKWKLFFAVSYDNGLFQEEKCSHIGAVKVAIDGTGTLLGRDLEANFIELEILKPCKAHQDTHILMV
jgi:hypothetical protein